MGNGPIIAGIPDTVSDLNKKNTDTVNTVAMHACRIQEAEQHIQEMATLQRKLAASMSSRPDLKIEGANPNNPLEIKFAKLESEFSDLQARLSHGPTVPVAAQHDFLRHD